MSTRRGELKPREIFIMRDGRIIWLSSCQPCIYGYVFARFIASPAAHTHAFQPHNLCNGTADSCGLMVAVTTKNEENINWISRTHTIFPAPYIRCVSRNLLMNNLLSACKCNRYHSAASQFCGGVASLAIMPSNEYLFHVCINFA